MVYDDRGSHVGDMHWRRDYEFGEGEEIELERGGIIVQVQDLVRRSEQDLSELLDKRAKEKEQRQLQAVARARGPTSVLPQSMPQSTPQMIPRPVPLDHFQLRHRPLHQLIGTPSGHHGRAAVPQESPYESRQQNADSPDDRAAKRRKYEDDRPTKKGHAQALFGQTLTLSATPMSTIPARHQSRKEPSSSMSVYDEEDASGQRRENALREQAKSSLYFNSNKTCSKVSTNRNQSPGLDPRLERNTIPAHAQIIDLEDQTPPEPSSPAIATAELKERRAVEGTSKAESKSKTGPLKDVSSRKTLPRSLAAPAERRKDPISRAKPANIPRTASSTVIRPVPEEVVQRSTGETSHSDRTTRKPDRPMTELRLKPTKKRGLLIMSNKPNRSLRQDTPRVTPPAAPTFEEVDQVIEESEDLKPLDKPLDISMELGEEEAPFRPPSPKASSPGEEDDPFRSPSPRPQEERRDGNEEAETILPAKEREDAKTRIEANAVLVAKDNEVRENSTPEEPEQPGLPAGGHRDDAYRIPSSSPEDKHPEARHQKSSTPAGREDVNAGGSSLPVDANVTDKELGDSVIKASAAVKRSRKMRRKIVLDDDEQSSTPLKAAGMSVSNAEISGMHNLALSSDSDDAPRKQRKSPTRAARQRKRKSVTEDEESETLANEEPPQRRRRATRRTQHPKIVSESSLASSEEEVEQEKPAKSRKKKAAQVVEEKPRLTKVKRSVKSRELIGLDLSALNVPLGLRGIGLPFSILSTPADETSSKEVRQKTMKRSSSNAGFENDGQEIQYDARKPTVPIKKTAKATPPTNPKNPNEVQCDQELLSDKMTAQLCCAPEPTLPGQGSESSCVQMQQETTLDQDMSLDDPVVPMASEQILCEEKVDTNQSQGGRLTPQLPKETPKEDSSPSAGVYVDVSRQVVVADHIKESSSTTKADNLDMETPLKEQALIQSLQCEPITVKQGNKEGAGNDTVSASKTTPQEPALSLSRGDSTKSEPAIARASVPEPCQANQQEVGQSASAAPDPQPRTVGLRRTISAVRSINNLQRESSAPEASKGTTTVEDSKKPTARIANPATRGRKAALKSHAAGQAPQRILPPTQPALLIPISTADLAMTPIEEPRKELERPKKKMSFPGFQSARGEGPWSREAFDLLETGRPG